MRSSSRSVLLGMAAFAALAGASIEANSPQAINVISPTKGQANEGQSAPNRDASKATKLKAMLGGRLFGGKFKRRYPGCGWSVAQDRRMAKKRRNQQRNKRAHRSQR